MQEQGGPAGQPLAADPALELGRVAGAMRTFFARLSDPAMLPELPKLQASGCCLLVQWLGVSTSMPCNHAGSTAGLRLLCCGWMAFSLLLHWLTRLAATAWVCSLLWLQAGDRNSLSCSGCSHLYPQPCRYAGATAQSRGHPAGAAGAGRRICHRCMLCLLCLLWASLAAGGRCGQALADVDWMPADASCSLVWWPLWCAHILLGIQVKTAAAPLPLLCCSARRAERPSQRLPGSRGG